MQTSPIGASRVITISPADGLARRLRPRKWVSSVNEGDDKSSLPFFMFWLRRTMNPESVQAGVLCGQSTISEQIVFNDCVRRELASCTTTRSLSIIFRNVSLVSAQSTISTFHGKSDSEKSSARAALVASGSGLSVMMARSRSENSLAVHLAREPKAHTAYCGTWRWRMSRTMAQWSGRMSIWGSLTLGHPATVRGDRSLRAGSRECWPPLPERWLHRRCGWSWRAYRESAANAASR
ncbi:Uncharacterised protein [Ectopseudomonas mendocina]|nr:Uncharacterised protein [Pseudomonas mendocina]